MVIVAELQTLTKRFLLSFLPAIFSECVRKLYALKWTENKKIFIDFEQYGARSPQEVDYGVGEIVTRGWKATQARSSRYRLRALKRVILEEKRNERLTDVARGSGGKRYGYRGIT